MTKGSKQEEDLSFFGKIGYVNISVTYLFFFGLKDIDKIKDIAC